MLASGPGSTFRCRPRPTSAWIRSPFLESNNHGVVVVHGHSINPIVEERSNRIGIDTGAYRTGVLTALVVEGEDRRILDTSQSFGTERARIDFDHFEG